MADLYQKVVCLLKEYDGDVDRCVESLISDKDIVRSVLRQSVLGIRNRKRYNSNESYIEYFKNGDAPESGFSCAMLLAAVETYTELSLPIDPKNISQATAPELLRLPGYGGGSLRGVRDWLASHNLKLNEERRPWPSPEDMRRRREFAANG